MRIDVPKSHIPHLNPLLISHYLISNIVKRVPSEAGGRASYLEPDEETLAIRNCCFFILSENFGKAYPYLKRIKNETYQKAFRAILQVENEEFQEALETFRGLGNKFEPLPSFMVSLLLAKIGVAYFELGNRSPAFKFWRKACSLDRENYLAKMTLAFRRFLK